MYPGKRARWLLTWNGPMLCTENRATVKSLSLSDSIFCPLAHRTFQPKLSWASVRSASRLGRGMSWLGAATLQDRRHRFVISRQVTDKEFDRNKL